MKKKQSLFLFGPRGTGKTSLVRHLFKTEGLANTEIDLLRGDNYRRYLIAPEALGQEIRTTLKRSENRTAYFFIDEIQKVPALLDEVHALISEYPKRVSFVLTGSSARKLKRTGANLLAGRAITKYLHPLNSGEIDVDLSRALQFGTLPNIYLEPEMEIEKLDTYVTTYLKEEIQEEALVRHVDKFTRSLELAAQMNGEPINFTKLSKQCGVSTKSGQEYFEILSDTLIVRRIDGWAHSVKKQLLQAPRFWFFDCGVLNSLNGELRTQLKPASFRYGRLFETWLIQEVVRLNDDKNLGLRLNYWRDSVGNEVDLIVSRSTARPILGIEIKSSTRPDLSDVKGLAVLREEYPKLERWCLCPTPRAYSLDGVKFLPWHEGLAKLTKI